MYKTEHKYIKREYNKNFYSYYIPRFSRRQWTPVQQNWSLVYEEWYKVKDEYENKITQIPTECFEQLFIFLVSDCKLLCSEAYWFLRDKVCDNKPLDFSFLKMNAFLYAYKDDHMYNLHVAIENAEDQCLKIEDSYFEGILSGFGLKNKSGIYAIKLIDEGIDKKAKYVYIGKARNIQRRWTQHKRKLNMNSHGNYELQYLWNCYGQRNFQIVVLEEMQDDNKMKIAEKKWYEHYKHYRKLCNIANPMDTYKYKTQ